MECQWDLEQLRINHYLTCVLSLAYDVSELRLCCMENLR
jgi:hypothetical protein